MANNRESGGEGEEKVSKVSEKKDQDQQAGVEDIKKELARTLDDIKQLTSAELKELSDELEELSLRLPNTLTVDPDLVRNWEQLQQTLTPVISQHIATKEQVELLNSALVANMFIFDYNLHKWLAKISSDKCSMERLIKFITIKKIGVQLLQYKQNRLSALLQMLQIQANMYSSVVSVFNTAYAQIRSGLFDITQDLKWDAITATLISALVAISLEIGNIKNNIRQQIADDEFCIQGCSRECRDSMTVMAKTESNEGNKVAEVAERMIAMLEEMMRIELDKAKEVISKKDYTTSVGKE